VPLIVIAAPWLGVGIEQTPSETLRITDRPWQRATALHTVIEPVAADPINATTTDLARRPRRFGRPWC
jgi:hypothetical protein